MQSLYHIESKVLDHAPRAYIIASSLAVFLTFNLLAHAQDTVNWIQTHSAPPLSIFLYTVAALILGLCAYIARLALYNALRVFSEPLQASSPKFAKVVGVMGLTTVVGLVGTYLTGYMEITTQETPAGQVVTFKCDIIPDTVAWLLLGILFAWFFVGCWTAGIRIKREQQEDKAEEEEEIENAEKGVLESNAPRNRVSNLQRALKIARKPEDALPYSKIDLAVLFLVYTALLGYSGYTTVYAFRVAKDIYTKDLKNPVDDADQSSARLELMTLVIGGVALCLLNIVVVYTIHRQVFRRWRAMNARATR